MIELLPAEVIQRDLATARARKSTTDAALRKYEKQ